MAQNTSARALPLGVGLVAVLIAAAALVAMFVAQGYVEDERERALRAWQDRLALVADSRAEALVGWLDEQNAVLAGLAGNTALQLYLTELAASGGDRTQVTEEAAQAVYLRNLLIVVAERSGFTGTATGARVDRKSTRLNSSHIPLSRMPSSA